MNALVQDARFALRRLVKSPGFTLLAVFTLALGIGLNSAVFSVVNAVVLKPLPVDAPQELANVYTAGPKDSSFTHGPMAFPDYLDLREQSTSFDDMAAYILSGMLFEQDGESDFVLGELASGNYFSLLGVDAHVGRVLSTADDSVEDPQAVVVLSYLTWERRFGGDPGVVGSTIRLNGRPMTVVGVARKGFLGLARGVGPEVWVPMRMSDALKAGSITNSGDPTPGLDRLGDRARRWHWIVGRLSPGVSFEAARAELGTIQARLSQTYPETNDTRAFLLERTHKIRIMPGLDGPVHAASAVIMGLVSLVLLIACSNVANMLLARAVERRKEIATRLALGAGRAALLRQLFVENLAMSLGGGVLGLGLAMISNRLVESVELPIPVDLAFGLSLDFRVLLFTFVAATLTALIFGMAPALEATRLNLTTALRDESRGTGGTAKRRLRSGLVVAEVALSFLLLVCAGLSVRSMQNAQHIDPGFEAEGLVTASFNPELQGYDDAGSRDLYDRLAERLEALPGSRSVAFASHLPLTLNISMAPVATPGQESLPQDDWPLADTAWVGGGYFETLGVPILSGRGLSEQDVRDGRRVIVVNRTLAERFFAGRDAVGQRLFLDRDEAPFEIVGVAADGKYRTLGEEPRAFVYQSIAETSSTAWEVVLATEDGSDPSAAMASVRRLARELDDEIAIGGLTTVEDAISTALVLPRTSAALFGVFGLIGTMLALVGIYGVVSYMASQRTHEIGIRMAMGARRRDILVMVARDGLVLIGAGVAVGVVAAGLTTRLLASVLYEISATDLVTFGGVALLLMSVALLASLVPARRASGIHPVEALRWERPRWTFDRHFARMGMPCRPSKNSRIMKSNEANRCRVRTMQPYRPASRPHCWNIATSTPS